MSKNIFKRALLILPLLLMSLTAQEEVDAIENARQAKAAAERAAAAAEAATGAAIDAAAAKASKDARAKIVQGRKDEEARKQAEIDAAEEAELDAAASAAAKDAKRRMAAELGLEYEDEDDSTNLAAEDSTMNEAEMTEEVVARESLGYDIGFTGSVGFINGAYITNTPIGGSFVLKTPFGFKIGEAFDFDLSLAAGLYNGEGNNELLDAYFVGVGLNATLFDLVFSETHLGYLGAGVGIRNFNGVSLDKIMNKGLGLPINILIGLEGFLATKADNVLENSTYWAGLGIRLDYSF